MIERRAVADILLEAHRAKKIGRQDFREPPVSSRRSVNKQASTTGSLPASLQFGAPASAFSLVRFGSRVLR
jgi:hypothetical protein